METNVLSPQVFDGSFCGCPGDLPPGEAGGACKACPLKAENFDLRQQVGYYQTQHQRARQREEKLQQEVAELQVKLRLRQRQLFGRKSEKGNSRDQNQQKNKGQDKAKKPRGQQAGSQGHPRQDYSHLPAEEEIYELPEGQCQCPECGLPLQEFPGTEDSEQIEINVRAHRRVIRRRRYRPACRCNKLPGIVTAPGPADWRVISSERSSLESPGEPDGFCRAGPKLRNHWEGLTLFVDRPEIPMDNSEAERQMRPLAVCRKIFYGSFSLWSGRLAAMMFSLFATLRLWKLNPSKWLTAYLTACAENGGQPPPDAKRFLPWNLSEDDRLSFAEEPAVEDSS